MGKGGRSSHSGHALTATHDAGETAMQEWTRSPGEGRAVIYAVWSVSVCAGPADGPQV